MPTSRYPGYCPRFATEEDTWPWTSVMSQTQRTRERAIEPVFTDMTTMSETPEQEEEIQKL